jgi:hypothetical protein
MKRMQLILLANVLALLAAAWAWSQFETAKRSVRSAQSKQLRCQKLIEEFEQLKANTVGKVVVADKNYDSSAMVAAAVKSAGLYDQTFSTSESSIGFVNGTQVKRWRVSLPEYSTSLKRTVTLVAALVDADMKFQVGHLELKRPNGNEEVLSPKGDEIWQTDFREITYLKESTKSR